MTHPIYITKWAYNANGGAARSTRLMIEWW